MCSVYIAFPPYKIAEDLYFFPEDDSLVKIIWACEPKLAVFIFMVNITLF